MLENGVHPQAAAKVIDALHKKHHERAASESQSSSTREVHMHPRGVHSAGEWDAQPIFEVLAGEGEIIMDDDGASTVGSDTASRPNSAAKSFHEAGDYGIVQPGAWRRGHLIGSGECT
jgi:hypothetical protein